MEWIKHDLYGIIKTQKQCFWYNLSLKTCCHLGLQVNEHGFYDTKSKWS